MRSYSYSFDTANYIYSCWKFKNKVKNQIFNIGNPQEKYNLTQLLNIISSISKKKIKFKIDKSFYKTDRIKAREIFNRLCDNRKSVNKLKYRQKVNINEGIKKVLSQKKIYSDWPK